MNEIDNINLSNVYFHPGERLLRWMSIKGEGNISEFKSAVENISKELEIEKRIDET